MIVAKQVADLLTLSRVLLIFVLLWLGNTYGVNALPAAVLVLLFSWTTDALDGPIARRSRVQYHTWLGDHDLEVDMAVGAGLLAYMMISGLVSPLLGVAYVLVWALVFWRWGVLRSPGMLFQGPIYGGFIWLAITQVPFYGSILVAWVLAVISVTWPRFPNEVIPEFLEGMRTLTGNYINKGG
jgi:phosphatidylglycerophosphate synthase